MFSIRIVIAVFSCWWIVTACPAQELGSSQDLALTTDRTLPILIHDVLVPAREPGIIENILVKEGQSIAAGDVIAELDSELYVLEQKAAQERLDVAELKATDDVDLRYSEKSKEVADATLARSDNATKQFPKSVSQTELDRLRLEVERAHLSTEKAVFDKNVITREAQLNLFELQAAELKLKLRSIASPVDGLVVQLIPQRGEWVNAGAPIARIIQLETLRITALIEYDRIDQSFVGRMAEFRPRNGNAVFQGPIKFVSPEVVPDTNLVQFYFDVDNPIRELLPGEPGTATILPPSQRP